MCPSWNRCVIIANVRCNVPSITYYSWTEWCNVTQLSQVLECEMQLLRLVYKMVWCKSNHPQADLCNVALNSHDQGTKWCNINSSDLHT